MGDAFERGRFHSLLADTICRFRERGADLPERELRAIEEALIAQWGGVVVKVPKIPAWRREAVRDLVRAGVPSRTAARRVQRAARAGSGVAP